MIIRTQISTIKGEFEVEYHSADSFEELPLEKCTQAYGICYCDGKIVLAQNIRGHYILPGGTVEPGETLEETLAREVQEESNMHILHARPIGYQKVWNGTTEPFFQTRFYAEVEPYGPFESDPAGHIIGIELVSDGDAPKMLGWGEIGDDLFARAKQLHLAS
jgi:8-oxo-dGTP pyrophosphatase MutT (NUDIX family)